jgi:glutamate-1-semialdehyde 2,1-aminomutase/spore coat polysaccharide biosynthesis protein SpsF
MRPLAGRSVLEHVIARCRSIPAVDAVCIASTVNAEDDAVVAEAERCGALVFRGSSADVLSRYAGAARATEAEIVLRVTSDCPLIDPAICERTLALRQTTGADYCANNLPRLYPHGLDCEAFTREALLLADREATDAYDREHVTPWLRRHPGISRSGLIGPGWPAVLQRWTLDYPEDYDFLAALFPLLPADRIPSSDEVLAILAEHPEIAAINRHRRIATAPIAGAPTVLFRFDADQKTGLGHAMRSNALASVLAQAGWRVQWAVSAKSAAFLRDAAPADALHIVADGAVKDQVSALLQAIGRCDLCVVDLPARPTEFESAARAAGIRVLAIDDLADAQSAAHVLVNPAPTVEPAAYAPLVPNDCVVLTGPRFALLRSQFPAARGLSPSDQRDAPQRIMVTFGGTDPLNGTGLALEALSGTDVARIDVMLGAKAPHLDAIRHQTAALGARCRLLIDVAEVARALADCDLVVGAPGGGTWERACLGLPSLLVGIAENQRANAESTEDAGASLLCGFLTTDDRAAVAARLQAALARIRGDAALYDRMRAAALALCDGRGVQRVAAAMLPGETLRDGATLTLRLAEAEDAAMLYAWQQAPETRRYALDQRPFSFAEHVAWLERKLSAPGDWLLIGLADGMPCGFLRLDAFGEDRGVAQALVSIAAAPGHYRRGIGAGLLRLARRLMPGAHFYAKVLPENTPSRALFRSCGYAEAGDGYFHATANNEATPT